MKITTKPQQDGKVTITIGHLDETFDLSSGDFKRDVLTPLNYDVFSQINDYWASLDADSQKRIFDVYASIKGSFSENLDRVTLTWTLSEKIYHLFALHNLQDIKHWLLYKNSGINIPDNTVLADEYIVNYDKPGSREQTYLRGDYIDLVCLSILLRTVVPIWGEFISRTKGDTGTAFKEYYAYGLLGNTDIEESAAIGKLLIYIRSNTPTTLPNSAIIQGVSMEDYPRWILALVVVRRLCTADIRAAADNPTGLVSCVFKYISQKVKSSDTSFSGLVLPKVDEKAGNDEESGGSKFEQYKIKQDITIGDKVSFEFYVNNTTAAARSLCPTINLDALQMALESSKALEGVELHPMQIALAKWIYKPVISTKAFQYFNKTTVIKTLAVSQCVLLEWGYPELAAIITATQHSTTTIRIHSTDIKKYLPELDRLYPHHRQSSTKSKTSKTVNPAIAAIEAMALAFSTKDWYLNLNESLLNTVNPVAGTRLYIAPGNIKSRIADLVVNKIATRSKFYTPSKSVAVETA